MMPTALADHVNRLMRAFYTLWVPSGLIVSGRTSRRLWAVERLAGQGKAGSVESADLRLAMKRYPGLVKPFALPILKEASLSIAKVLMDWAGERTS